ncbi:hypothetical protein CASFOL_002981 [Castilleja foliolosa]|uniref:L-ascorbate oxidase n=1 Tax=Castilleja foliolosa TaxID=1961234 RepID=A0ABD3EG82_9LAMI
MRAISFFTCCLIVLSMTVELAMGIKLSFEWEVTKMLWSPDGVSGSLLAINGQFPGPTINASTGDNIVVKLTNGLESEGLTIHWHGIRQLGTPWADGASNISQCPIESGNTYTYNFIVDKAGTYFYHGHYQMIRTGGLYGMLIVNDVDEKTKIKQNYDGELSLLLSDWWHTSYKKQEVDLASKPMIWVGEPPSLLINGRGQYNCSLAASVSKSSTIKPQCNFSGNEQYAPDILYVEPNKTYRLRIASSTSLASLSFAVGNHKLRVVEADGNLVEHFDVDSLYIYPGQTYSVLLNTNQSPNTSHWVSVDVIGRNPNTTQGLTVLTYYDNSTSIYDHLPTSPPPVPPVWNDTVSSKSFANKIFALEGSPTPPPNSDKIIQLLNTQNLIDGYTKWAINDRSLVLPSTPYLASIKYNKTNVIESPPESFNTSIDITIPPVNPNVSYTSGAYKLSYNETVDIILQNANALKANVSEVHPWHLHGHDFWVLGYGQGMFNYEKDKASLNLNNPPYRHTVALFPNGWTALRFVADNPGAWAFHCHIEPHTEMGMGVVFLEGVDKIGDNIPGDGLQCAPKG